MKKLIKFIPYAMLALTLVLLFKVIKLTQGLSELPKSEDMFLSPDEESPSFLDHITPSDTLRWDQKINLDTFLTGEAEFAKVQGSDWKIMKASLKKREVVTGEDPNLWMALMAYESEYTCKSKKLNKYGYTYYGLGEAALSDILKVRKDLRKYGTSPAQIAAQPDYVELEFMYAYMSIVKGRAKKAGTNVDNWGPQDFYLAWHRPNDAIHGRRGILVPANWAAAKANPDLQIKNPDSKQFGAITYWSISFYFKDRSQKLSNSSKVTALIPT